MTITGHVREGREAVVVLLVRGPRGRSATIDAVIDTGFTAYLTLPLHLIERLKLPLRRRGRAMMADGRVVVFDVHEARVLWDGELRRVAISAADTEPLVGMALLKDYALYVEVTPAGRVTIERLP